MPRDGLQQYAPPPGTQGVANYTVESARYNTFVADITADQNAPRPIVAGGTGASSGPAALVNLGGENASQLVDNYDTFPFVAGSFHSLAGATSAPNSSNIFAGICYLHDNGSITLEARIQGPATTTANKKYVRQKWSTWSPWFEQAGGVADLDAAYVNVTGDTMTGRLDIAMPDPILALNKVAGAHGNSIIGTVSAVPRWAISPGNSSPESSGNAGSDFGLSRFSDAGAFLGTSLGIVRATGAAQFESSIAAGITGTTGTYYFGNTGTKFLNYDGTNFSLAGGALLMGTNALKCGDLTASINGTTGIIRFNNAGDRYLYYDGTNYSLPNAPLNTGTHNIGAGNLTLQSPNAGGNTPPAGYAHSMIYGGTTQFGMALRAVADASAYNAISFLNSGAAPVGSITCTSGATAYNTTSSAELKEDLKSFDAGNIIDNTNVYDFKWKSSSERAYGVLAQQAVEVYPTAVTHVTNPEDKTEFWGVDYSKYVPVLLQELKALRTRVAELEGRLLTKPA